MASVRYKSGFRYCRNATAFTLVELLAVMAIFAALGMLVLPAITNITASRNLARAESQLRGELQVARHLSISRNLSVIVNLCQRADDLEVVRFNTIILQVQKSDGSLEIISKPLRFPVAFTLSEDPEWSSLMTLPKAKVSLNGGELDCIQFRFRPNGSTTLASSTNWFVTLYDGAKGAAPSSSFSTVRIDPITGRATSYRP